MQAVKQAWQAPVPVKVGAGVGYEQRISENRRLKMKDGSEVDMHRAYSMPPDADVAGVGRSIRRSACAHRPRRRHAAGRRLQLCLPSDHDSASKGSSADFPGYASKVIEESLGHRGWACSCRLAAATSIRFATRNQPAGRCGAAGEHARPERDVAPCGRSTPGPTPDCRSLAK